jgi:hypothetical protein
MNLTTGLLPLKKSGLRISVVRPGYSSHLISMQRSMRHTWSSDCCTGKETMVLEIATRCGQDSDCNPASAGGILGSYVYLSEIVVYSEK